MEKRIISWGLNEGDKISFSRAFIFGNYNDSFAAYRKLVKEAKKDFPSLKEEDIICGKVHASGYMDGYICISFPLYPTSTCYGYVNWKRFDFRY